jgi:hypothetical protein
MPIAYAAHTESCTLYLDEDGVCREIVRRAAALNGVRRADADAAARCIGAQYVAALDLTAGGGLVAMPKVGSPMLFAFVAEGGRIVLVRTGRLLRFEDKVTRPTPVPVRAARKLDSGVREVPVDDIDVDAEDDILTRRFRYDVPSSRPATARAPEEREGASMTAKRPGAPSAPTLTWVGRAAARSTVPRKRKG